MSDSGKPPISIVDLRATFANTVGVKVGARRPTSRVHAVFFVDAAARQVAPTILENAGAQRDAQTLRALVPIGTPDSTEAAKHALSAITETTDEVVAGVCSAAMWAAAHLVVGDLRAAVGAAARAFSRAGQVGLAAELLRQSRWLHYECKVESLIEAGLERQAAEDLLVTQDESGVPLWKLLDRHFE